MKQSVISYVPMAERYDVLVLGGGHGGRDGGLRGGPGRKKGADSGAGICAGRHGDAVPDHSADDKPHSGLCEQFVAGGGIAANA